MGLTQIGELGFKDRIQDLKNKVYYCTSCKRYWNIGDGYISSDVNVKTFARLCDDCYEQEYKDREKKALNDLDKAMERLEEKRIQNAINSLPAIYRNAEDKYNMRPLIDKHYKNSLFISGPVGGGKTFMATMFYKKHVYLGHSPKFVSFPRVIFDIQRDYDSAGEIVDYICTYKQLLILDDFGGDRLTDFVRQVIYLIINERQTNDYQTIITSNYTLDDLEKQIDSRISSRINALCIPIHLQGKDKRNKK